MGGDRIDLVDLGDGAWGQSGREMGGDARCPKWNVDFWGWVEAYDGNIGTEE